MWRSIRTVLITVVPEREKKRRLVALRLLKEKKSYCFLSKNRGRVQLHLDRDGEIGVTETHQGLRHFKVCGLSSVCISGPSVFVQDSSIWNM